MAIVGSTQEKYYHDISGAKKPNIRLRRCDVKFRKESTRRRCEIIRDLSPDGIISWAITYAPTLRSGGSMSSDVFDCLDKSIEPELGQSWQAVIQDMLQ